MVTWSPVQLCLELWEWRIWYNCTSPPLVMVTRNPVQICLGSWEQGIQYKFVLDEGLKKSSTSLPWIKGTRNLQRTLSFMEKGKKTSDKSIRDWGGARWTYQTKEVWGWCYELGQYGAACQPIKGLTTNLFITLSLCWNLLPSMATGALKPTLKKSHEILSFCHQQVVLRTINSSREDNGNLFYLSHVLYFTEFT